MILQYDPEVILLHDGHGHKIVNGEIVLIDDNEIPKDTKDQMDEQVDEPEIIPSNNGTETEDETGGMGAGVVILIILLIAAIFSTAGWMYWRRKKRAEGMAGTFDSERMKIN